MAVVNKASSTELVSLWRVIATEADCKISHRGEYDDRSSDWNVCNENNYQCTMDQEL